MADYISRYTGEEIDERLAAVPDKYTMPAGGIPSTDLAEDVQTSLGKADSAIQSLAPVTDLIPAAASTTNQLADKAFVNSSVATNTANYISDNGEPFASLAALEAYSGPLTNNDYAFVVGTDSAGNTTYTRYKYNATTQTWAEEYVLNNSSFTAGQWDAINSGITADLVTAFGNKYSKPSGGIPASDLASGVIPSVPVQDVTVGGTSVVSNGTAAVPAIPTVPDISTDVAADKTSNTKTSSPKSVYDAIHPAVGSAQPAGGFLPNVMYALGTLTGSVTFALAAAVSGIVNHYFWSFTAGSTAPTITWPSGLTWVGGSAPELTAGNKYEISVLDGVAAFLEVEVEA